MEMFVNIQFSHTLFQTSVYSTHRNKKSTSLIFFISNSQGKEIATCNRKRTS